MDRDQVKAARALLRWTAEDLAQKSKVGLSTINQAIQRALEDGGIEFIAENGGGLGVRLKAKR